MGKPNYGFNLPAESVAWGSTVDNLFAYLKIYS